MKTSSYIPNSLLSRDAVELGRLIVNLDSPGQDCCDVEIRDILSAIAAEDIILRKHADVDQIIKLSQSSTVNGIFTTILSTKMGGTQMSSVHLKTVQHLTYE